MDATVNSTGTPNRYGSYTESLAWAMIYPLIVKPMSTLNMARVSMIFIVDHTVIGASWGTAIGARPEECNPARTERRKNITWLLSPTLQQSYIHDPYYGHSMITITILGDRFRLGAVAKVGVSKKAHLVWTQNTRIPHIRTPK